MRVPSGALQLTEIHRSISDRLIPALATPIQNQGPVVEQLKIDVNAIAFVEMNARVDPRVMFARAPETFGRVRDIDHGRPCCGTPGSAMVFVGADAGTVAAGTC